MSTPDDPVIRTLARGFPWETEAPFLFFCVHHDDAYPRGNEEMGPAAPRPGEGVSPSSELPGRGPKDDEGTDESPATWPAYPQQVAQGRVDTLFEDARGFRPAPRWDVVLRIPQGL